MAAIKACFNCKICDNVFIEPVILPCGNSICQSHVTFEEIFTCQICSLEHPIPKEGFIANKLIKDLITTKIHDNLSEKNNQKILNSFSLLENTIQEIEHLEKNPDDFITDFFAKLIHKIDLKREENKIDAEKHFQNVSSELNTLKDDQNLEKIVYYRCPLRKFSSYFTINELKVFKENTKTKKELAISYLENIDRKKKECVNEVESLYTQLLDEMTEKRNNCMKFSETKKLSVSIKTKIEKIKLNLDEFNQNLKQIFFTDELYDSIKQKTNDDRILLNNAIRDFKNELLLEKGFDLEKKEFEFPKFSKIILSNFLTLKSKTFCFDFSADDLMKKKRGTILMSEKSVLNGISFYTGLKLEKNNCLYACLYCSNDYEFSGIEIDYSFKINNFKEKNFKYVFRHFGAGFKKLIKNPIECKKRLVTRITIKNLNNRTSVEEKIERKLKLNINERCKTRSIKPKVMSLIEFNQIDSNYFRDDKDCMAHDDY